MPIEQLLARYGIARDGGGAAPPAAPAPGPGAARRAARGGRRGATAGAEADAAPRAESPEGDGVEGAERPAKRRRAEAGEAGGAPPPDAVLGAADAMPGACCRVKCGNAQCALAKEVTRLLCLPAHPFRAAKSTQEGRMQWSPLGHCQSRANRHTCSHTNSVLVHRSGAGAAAAERRRGRSGRPGLRAGRERGQRQPGR
jgi:hypothetical protein